MAKSEVAVERQPRGKPKLRSIEIEGAKNGGHIITHRFHSGSGMNGYKEPEVHAFGPAEGKKAIAHVKQHMATMVGMPAAAQAAPGVAAEEE